MQTLTLTIGVVFLFFSLQAQNAIEIANWYNDGKNKQADEEFKKAAESYVKAIALCPGGKLDKQTEVGKDCINCHFNIGVCAFNLEKYIPAERAFSNVLESDPSDHEAFARRGQARTEMGDSRGALSDLQNAVILISENWNDTDDYYRIWYTYDLAIAHRNLNQLEEALGYMNTVVALDNDPLYRQERAELLYELGKMKELEGELDDMEEKGTLGDHLNFERGLTHMYNTRYDKAIPYFTQVKDEKDISFAVRNLAICHIELNELAPAKNHALELEKMAYNPAEIAWIKSRIFSKEGDWDKAIDQANLAESLLLPDDPLKENLALQRANIHYKKGEFRDAIGECSSIPFTHLLYLEASSLKAMAHLEVGEKKEAGDILIKEKGLHPNNPMIQGRIAWFLFRSGLKKEAALELSELTAQFNFSAEMMYYTAEVNYQLERYSHEECLRLLDRALELEPSKEEIYVLKARLLYEQGRKDEALRNLQIAEKLGITHTYSTYNAAAIRLLEGDAEMALALSSISILRAPQEPEFQRQHGIAFFNVGDWNGAISYLSKAIENNSSDKEAIKARGLSYMMLGEHAKGTLDFDKLSTLEGLAYRNEGDSSIKKWFSQPDFSSAYIRYSRLFSQNMPDEENYYNAVNLLEKALFEAEISNKQKVGMIYNELGLLKWSKGKWEEALESFNFGILKDPGAILHRNRARLYYEMGKEKEAENDMLKAQEWEKK